MRSIYKVYLSGDFAESGSALNVYDKYSGEVFAKVVLADAVMLEKAIADAVSSEVAMKNLRSYEKFKILKYISDSLMKEIDNFASIIAAEAGKPLKYALIEVERAAQTFMIAAEESKRISAELLTLDWYSNVKKEAVVKLFPVGLVAGISPFNFPLNLVAHKVAPAIAAGCPMIIKPASATPVSALELARIIKNSGLPKKAFSVLPMSHKDSNALIEDDRIKKLSFTGSPDVGWQLKSRCRKKKITLELGGNAAAIITPSADINEAVAKCVTGAFAYSGQVCIHTQRIFVNSEIYDVFVEKFLEKTAKLVNGNPHDHGTDVSVLIDNENALRVENSIKQALNSGAKLLAGGKRKGNFIEPTVLSNTTPDMQVWKDEIFGPVVIIEKYEKFPEAVDMVNDSVFGLQAGVFTNNIEEMNTAYNEINAGGIMINESPTFRLDNMPYGGIKDSGFGREGVKFAIHEMSEPKLLVKPV